MFKAQENIYMYVSEQYNVILDIIHTYKKRVYKTNFDTN